MTSAEALLETRPETSGPDAEPEGFSRVLAVGDVHGDLDALLRILTGGSVLDDEGDWIARGTRVVLMGDVNGRGPDAANVVAFLMELESAAREAGGRVDVLLGNHEMLAAAGDFTHAHPVEAASLERFRFGGLSGLDAFYRGRSRYARWLRGRPAALTIGTAVFVHAGLDERCAVLGATRMTAALRAWAAWLQGAGVRPDPSTGWLWEETGAGPLWTRRFRALPGAPPAAPEERRSLERILDAFGAERMVVGHKPTREMDWRVCLDHPSFGSLVSVVDTGISAHYGGRLSCLEIAGDSWRACYFRRGLAELELTREVRARQERARALLGEREGPGA